MYFEPGNIANVALLATCVVSPRTDLRINSHTSELPFRRPLAGAWMNLLVSLGGMQYPAVQRGVTGKICWNMFPKSCFQAFEPVFQFFKGMGFMALNMLTLQDQTQIQIK